MKEELVAGLRNALDRGATIDQAIQSFLNAGYNNQEVSEAANFLNHGALNVVNASAKSPKTTLPIVKNLPSEQDIHFQPLDSTPPVPVIPYNQSISLTNIPVKRKRNGLIIFLIVLLVLIVLGIILVVLMKDQLASFIADLSA